MNKLVHAPRQDLDRVNTLEPFHLFKEIAPSIIIPLHCQIFPLYWIILSLYLKTIINSLS